MVHMTYLPVRVFLSRILTGTQRSATRGKSRIPRVPRKAPRTHWMPRFSPWGHQVGPGAWGLELHHVA